MLNKCCALIVFIAKKQNLFLKSKIISAVLNLHVNITEERKLHLKLTRPVICQTGWLVGWLSSLSA
jgi:hypothetical protein